MQTICSYIYQLNQSYQLAKVETCLNNISDIKTWMKLNFSELKFNKIIGGAWRPIFF